MLKGGIILNDFLPNLTEVTAVMDGLFITFKCFALENMHIVFAHKIKANAAPRCGASWKLPSVSWMGHVVPSKEQIVTVTVANLNPGDLGEILFGELIDDGYPAADSPVAVDFMKEEIVNSQKRCSTSVVHFSFTYRVFICRA